jgi:hypothetical protein
VQYLRSGKNGTVFLSTVANGNNQVKSPPGELVDRLAHEPLSWNSPFGQSANGQWMNEPGWTSSRGDSPPRSGAQLVPDSFRHLRAAGIARAEN